MQAVPLGFYLFLVELAAGSILVTAILDWDGEVSPGFLLLNGAFSLGFGAAGIGLRAALPPERLLPFDAPAFLLQWELAVWIAFIAAGAVQLFCLKTERRAAGRMAGSAAALLGVGGLVLNAGIYRPPAEPPLLVLASSTSAALALGTVWSGMMLGHWYLVTPRLATRPLLRLNAALAVALAARAALLAFVAGSASAELEAGAQWFVWLRALVGIGFPLALTWMIWHTARARSMMSATGLLYIALGAVLSGEIMAKSLLFIAQKPV